MVVKLIHLLKFYQGPFAKTESPKKMTFIATTLLSLSPDFSMSTVYGQNDASTDLVIMAILDCFGHLVLTRGVKNDKCLRLKTF